MKKNNSIAKPDWREILHKTPVYLFLILGSLLMVFPFIWMILTSFKTHAEAIMFPPKFWPANFSFINYRQAFSMAPFGKYFINSVIVMVLSVLTTTTTTTAPVTTTAVTTTAEPEPLRGDVIENNEVAVDDAQRTLIAYTDRISGKPMKLTDRQIKAADVDRNGTVSVEDAQLILKYYTEKYVAGKNVTWESILKK